AQSNGRTYAFPGYFFFQAEDGIRDLYVTGVQTCALPILANRPLLSRPFRTGDALSVLFCSDIMRTFHSGRHWAINAPFYRMKRRSEERRVGKECRSGWSPGD